MGKPPRGLLPHLRLLPGFWLIFAAIGSLTTSVGLKEGFRSVVGVPCILLAIAKSEQDARHSFCVIRTLLVPEPVTLLL